MLKPGLYSVRSGMIAAIVTHLEMRDPPVLRPEITAANWRFEKLKPNSGEYRDLYRSVGEEWLWVSRLLLDDDELNIIIGSPEVEIYKLSVDTGGVGMVELDFREPGACELVFFGVSGPLIGGPAARWLINRAIERAWSRPIKRFWLHTCTLDHPKALAFYKRSGFQPFRFEVEVLEDPRLTGMARKDAAPHIPLLPPAR
jgi:GNAT superfamily N-acetyltransferase